MLTVRTENGRLEYMRRAMGRPRRTEKGKTVATSVAKCGTCGQETAIDGDDLDLLSGYKCRACGSYNRTVVSPEPKVDTFYLPVWVLDKYGKGSVRIVKSSPWTAGAWSSRQKLVLALASLCSEWKHVPDDTDPFADAVTDAETSYPLLKSSVPVRDHANGK